MKTTRIISESEIIPNRASGYRLVKGEMKNQTWVSPSLNTTADGSLYFTIEDLAKWDDGLRSGKILAKEKLEEMWKPVVLNNGEKQKYGFGWVIVESKNGHKTVEHSGEWQGFTSHIARYLEDALTVVVLCNLAGSDSAYIAHKVAGFYDPSLAPPEHRAITLDVQKMESFAGKYRLDDRLTVEIKNANSKLTMEFLGQDIEMLPETDRIFFEVDSERTFEFQLDKDGNVTGMILRLPMELKFRRMKEK
jgi:CubicO group peptidase (beta-lactamase class C family)